MGKYTVIVSRRADAMLVGHTRFLANVSIPAAKGLIAEFERKRQFSRRLYNPEGF